MGNFDLIKRSSNRAQLHIMLAMAVWVPFLMSVFLVKAYGLAVMLAIAGTGIIVSIGWIAGACVTHSRRLKAIGL